MDASWNGTNLVCCSQVDQYRWIIPILYIHLFVLWTLTDKCSGWHGQNTTVRWGISGKNASTTGDGDLLLCHLPLEWSQFSLICATSCTAHGFCSTNQSPMKMRSLKEDTEKAVSMAVSKGEWFETILRMLEMRAALHRYPLQCLRRRRRSLGSICVSDVPGSQKIPKGIFFHTFTMILVSYNQFFHLYA